MCVKPGKPIPDFLTGIFTPTLQRFHGHHLQREQVLRVSFSRPGSYTAFLGRDETDRFTGPMEFKLGGLLTK
jgi:hypothetical protein